MARKDTVRRASRVVVLFLFACFAIAALFFLMRVFAEVLPAGQKFFTAHYSLTIVNVSQEPVRITPIGSKRLGGPKFPLPCKCDGDRVGWGQRANFPLAPSGSFKIYGKSSKIWFTSVVVQSQEGDLFEMALNQDLFGSAEAYDSAQPLSVPNPWLMDAVSLTSQWVFDEAQSPRPFKRDVLLLLACLVAFGVTNWWHKKYGYEP